MLVTNNQVVRLFLIASFFIGPLTTSLATADALPLLAGDTCESLVLPDCDIAIRYENVAEGSPVRVFFNPKQLTGPLKQTSKASIGLYQDFSSADRVGPPEKVYLWCYSSTHIGNLKQVVFNSDFKDRNECHLSTARWSKNSVCNWLNLEAQTSKLVEDFAVYDVHSLGKKKIVQGAGGVNNDPVEDYKIICCKIGEQTILVSKKPGGALGGSFFIKYQIQKNSLAPSKPSINLNDQQWQTFYW